MMIFQKVLLIFTIIGGINWGLIGFFNFNLVEFLTNSNVMIDNVIYSIIGICAVINIYILFTRHKNVM
ncbi:MAG: DUF378 domain-containing protein [bacterium]